MKYLFNQRSRSSLSNTAPVSEPLPDPEPTTIFSTSPASEASTSGLGHLIPNDSADDEPNFVGTENPISLDNLFDFDNNQWAKIYNGHAGKHLAEELALCELLNHDAATDEGAEVDVDEMTGEILMA